MSAVEIAVEGHPGVLKRGNRYTTRVKDRRGRVRRVNGRTLKELLAKRAALQTDLARGVAAASSTVTFREYAEEWVESYKGRTSRGIRPETVADYKRGLERHAYPVLGRMRLVDVEPRDVRALVTAIERKGLAPNSVRLALAPVKAMLATAVDDGIIRSNPASGLRLTTRRAEPTGEPDVKALTEPELAKLIQATPERWQLLVAFLAQTGLRIGECVALEWRDVDFGRRRVRVERRLYRGRIDDPKSRYGRRTIPLTAEMTRRLWEHRKSAVDGADRALLFPGRSAAGYLDRNSMSQTWLKKAAETAGVPWAGFHTLRHTCATMLFRHGLNAGQVQLWLGHHSAAFTLATYVHLLPSDLPEPPAIFDQLGGHQTPAITAAPAVVRAAR